MRATQRNSTGDVTQQGDLEGLSHGSGDLGLELQDVAKVSVLGLRPRMKCSDGVDQLRGDTDRVSRAAHASLLGPEVGRKGRDHPSNGGRAFPLTSYLVAGAEAVEAVSVARGVSEFHVSRMIIHFPSLRCNTVRNLPVSMVAPDLSVLV